MSAARRALGDLEPAALLDLMERNGWTMDQLLDAATASYLTDDDPTLVRAGEPETLPGLVAEVGAWVGAAPGQPRCAWCMRGVPRERADERCCGDACEVRLLSWEGEGL